MVFTEGQRFGSETTVFWIYGAKTIMTALVLWFCFKDYKVEITGGWDPKAVLLGLVVLFLWVLPAEFLADTTDIRFNPHVFSGPEKYLAISFRVLGASLVVPVMEELLWRSFLMRYLIDKDFLKIPVGTYQPVSFWVTVVAFMLVHAQWEWPMAIIAGILYGAYVVKTKNIWGCIIAHAVTNFGLALYVLATGKWFFW